MTGGDAQASISPTLAQINWRQKRRRTIDRAAAAPKRRGQFHIIYVSVNPLEPGQRSRTRHAVREIRHVFLDADRDACDVLARIADRPDLPAPSYVLHSSPDRVHVLWRVAGFVVPTIEALQKQLARELQTDPAATPCNQTTRMPGYDNHKYDEPYRVWIEYRDVDRVFQPRDFPRAGPRRTTWQPPRGHSHAGGARSRMERARLYIRQVPPAVAGQHGDVHTFRTCCRLTRGFALEDDEALAVLTDWNTQCQPPWDEADLRDKIRHARRYGREPVGGML